MVSYLDQTGLEHTLEKLRNQMYPVGSLYFSTNSTSPATIYGGTWERYGKGRTLVSVNESDTDFTAGKTGGEKTHSHTYGIVVGDYYGMPVMRHDGPGPHTGVIDYELKSGNKVRTHGNAPVSSATEQFSVTVSGSWGPNKMSIWNNEANTTKESSLQPYISVYVWRRTA